MYSTFYTTKWCIDLHAYSLVLHGPGAVNGTEVCDQKGYRPYQERQRQRGRSLHKGFTIIYPIKD